MQYKLISSAQQLNEFCQSARSQPALAVDTEFVRTRTLTPQLGLIQLYDGQNLVLVDPLSIDDFSALNALLTEPSIIKVLHSCSEDMEAFWTFLKVLPSPVFDTQIAAGLLNMGNSLGYAKLVETELSIVLDKGESRTDWLARPLSEKQLSYAANDVLYLWQLYPRLHDATVANNKLQWIYDDVQRLGSKKSYRLPSDAAYYGFKHNWQLHDASLLILKELAGWRLETARDKDISLNFIVKENALVEIAKWQPTELKQLHKIADMGPRDIRKYGKVIIAIVNKCLSAEITEYPEKVVRLADFSAYKKTCQKLRTVCQRVADKHQIPVELLASKKQINHYLMHQWVGPRFASEYDVKPDILASWRYSLLASELDSVMSVLTVEETSA